MNRKNIKPYPYFSEEVENGGFTLKTHRMFFVHTTPEEFENVTITSHYGVVVDMVEENSVREIT